MLVAFLLLLSMRGLDRAPPLELSLALRTSTGLRTGTRSALHFRYSNCNSELVRNSRLPSSRTGTPRGSPVRSALSPDSPPIPETREHALAQQTARPSACTHMLHPPAHMRRATPRTMNTGVQPVGECYRDRDRTLAPMIRDSLVQRACRPRAAHGAVAAPCAPPGHPPLRPSPTLSHR
jgi:hypothetical protein